jgi:hypothetical protein
MPHPRMVPFSEDDSRRFVGRLEKTRATLEKLAATLDCFVVTVRGDFYLELMASSLRPQIQGHRLEVLPLDEYGLRLTITRPAEDAR